MWKCGGRRMKAEIARASRSDTHSDWSTTLGANYTYQLYLQYSVMLSIRYVLVYSLLTVQRSSPTFSRLQRLPVQPQNCILDLVPLFPVDGAGRTHERPKLSKEKKNTNFVASVRNFAFASSVTVVGFSCCSTEGNQESSCCGQTAAMFLNIVITFDDESSGKSPVSPDNR